MKRGKINEDSVGRARSANSVVADWMRFTFAAAVLFIHWAQTFGLLGTDLISPIETLHNVFASAPIHFGVVGFIIVSGFCIHLASVKLTPTPRSIASYIIRRGLRVVPTLAVAALLAWVLLGRDSVSFFNFLEPRTILALNGPLITVFIEVMLYAAYVPLILFIGIAPVFGWITITIISAVGLLTPFTVVTWLKVPIENDYHNFFFYFPFWWLGVVSANIFMSGQLRIRWPEVFAIVGLVGLVGFLFKEINFFFSKFAISMQVYTNLYTIVFALGVATLLAGIRTDFGTKWGKRFSSPSYSLYAIHAPLLFLTSDIQPLFSLAVIGIATLLLWRFVEIPTQRLARKLGNALAYPPASLRGSAVI